MRKLTTGMIIWSGISSFWEEGITKVITQKHQGSEQSEYECLERPEIITPSEESIHAEEWRARKTHTFITSFSQN